MPTAPTRKPALARRETWQRSAVPGRRTGRAWLASLTIVCFLFGGLMAMQLRAIERVRDNRVREAESQEARLIQMEQLRRKFDKEKQERAALEHRMQTLQKDLNKKQFVNHAQAQ